MNPLSIYHAYAMSYLELARAREEGQPVPGSVLARLAAPRREARRAVLRALRDLEGLRPMRSKAELMASFATVGGRA